MRIAVQTDRAAGQARQLDVYRRTWLNGELKPFFLENVGEVLLGLRAAFHRLCLDPVQIGCGCSAAVREFGSAVGPRRSAGKTGQFIDAARYGLIEAGYSIGIGGYVE